MYKRQEVRLDQPKKDRKPFLEELGAVLKSDQYLRLYVSKSIGSLSRTQLGQPGPSIGTDATVPARQLQAKVFLRALVVLVSEGSVCARAGAPYMLSIFYIPHTARARRACRSIKNINSKFFTVVVNFSSPVPRFLLKKSFSIRMR